MFKNNAGDTSKKKIKTAIIGCGNFATKYHLPNIKKIPDYELTTIVNTTGSKAKEIAKRNNIKNFTTDYHSVLSDQLIDMVVITTRHNLHVHLAIESIKANKHVFLEKPMALSLESAKELSEVVKRSSRKFTIGFNRRHSPLVKDTKQILSNQTTPIVINYRIANTFSPKNSWIHDPEEGGGMIMGECCHFFDLVYWLIGKEPQRIFAEGGNLTHPGNNIYDNAIITIKFNGGSIATITFTDLGSEDFPKERIEIFSGDNVIVIDDFKKMTRYGETKKEVVLKNTDKGHFNQFVKFAENIRDNTEPAVTYKDGLRSALCCIKTLESIKTNLPKAIDMSSTEH